MNSFWAAGDGHVERTVGKGFRDRTARVKCLGNAVVPQLVEVIGRAIVEAHYDVAKQAEDAPNV